jgi:gliding motility-associated-like protein
MKKFLLVTLCFIVWGSAMATHIAGGELYYQYIGPGSGNNTSKYQLTMRLFKECSSSSAVNLATESVIIGAYVNPGLTLQTSVTLTYVAPPASQNPFQNTPGAIPCLTGNVSSCYYTGLYTGQIELPDNTTGYTLVWTRYTRMSPIANITGSDLGGTFATQIPGTTALPNGHNSSPQFILKDTTIVCKAQNLYLDYSAIDADGDSLSYKFVTAYDGFGGSANNPNPFTTSVPTVFQIVPLTYTNGFTGTSPLGSSVSINAQTGLITGTAPTTPGKYVVCVAIEEWRNGEKINEHRKDFILTIGDCSVNQTNVGPDDKTCDGFTFNFSNLTTAQFTSYNWSFGDGATSTQPTPNHTYLDTGRYLVKLVAIAGTGCKDSASKYIYVFPGFTPKFTVTGSCYLNPYQFTNQTYTAYGVVDTTFWNFGDLTTLADTSHLRNPTYLYPTPGTYTVRLYATNTKGCQKDTLQNLIVPDKPYITLPFKDTLICSIDTLQLQSSATGGTYTWQPSTSNVILNPNTPNPLVFPKDTTTFVLTINNNGCINKDSIKVNVLKFITVDAGLDTAICRTDTFRLRPISYALSYLWTASTGEVVAPVKYPLVKPLSFTKYVVKANLGKCEAKDSVFVKVAPYPQVNAADVGPICYGKSVQLNANIVGSFYTWSPTTNMLNATTLTPTVSPTTTTSYILTVTDTVGCLKPVKDTVKVVVIPPITAFAGNDTAVVIGQPLQMFVATNATSLSPTTYFLWTPSIWLNSDTIQNPIATINTVADSIKYAVAVTTADGCIGQDEIVVKVFKTAPDIFVPTGFTPNKDGRNDILKPICVGITKLEYFRVFNRWGQLVYETREFNKGWDGTVNGQPQDNGTYVFMAQGSDYTGKIVFRKGTTVLIR